MYQKIEQIAMISEYLQIMHTIVLCTLEETTPRKLTKSFN